MSRLSLYLRVLLVLAYLSVLPAGRQHPITYNLDRVTQLIQTAVARIPLSGASLLLIKDGAPIYEEAFGAFNRDTVLPIASGSKWLSASVIMTLVDEGRIGLDDPISRYLPEFSGAKGRITIRQLLSHTSGLPDMHPCLGDGSLTLEQCVRQISLLGLTWPPGTCFGYGNLSFAVAGRVAEVAAGKPWATLFEERIRAPLNMTATTYGNTNHPVIGGSVLTNLHDYGSFLQMLLGDGSYAGRQVLSSASVREMRRDQTFGIPIAVSMHSDGRRYGLGEWLDAVGSDGSATQVSSQGDTGFSPWIDLQRNLAGVFLVDDSLGNIYGLVAQVQQAVREAIDSAVAQQAATSPLSWDTWLGVRPQAMCAPRAGSASQVP